MNWDDLKIVLAVFRSGNAGTAATDLGLSHATISRRMAEIERSLGVALVDRSGLSWRPTPICAQVAAQAEQMEVLHDEALRVATAHSSDLSGPVHISVPTGTIEGFVAEALQKLPRLAPDIRLIFITEDQLSDLPGRKADIAVRFTSSPDPDLIGQKVTLSAWGFYSCTDLAEVINAQMDAKTAVLAPILTTERNGAFPQWASGHFDPASPCHFVYGFPSKAAMAAQGFGVALLPRVIGDGTPGLTLLDRLNSPLKTELWVLANSDTRSSKRISQVKRVLIDGLTTMQPRFFPADVGGTNDPE
ncbi:LysR family transcriptional regulator [uncultured Litoreibacter sp.]|uniref:LysR family transcriptional regulator n=1 Tax=uncultured Litoreibacter sp. TaxID=1392394 RepID=UPI00260B3282|nr:LysR family transcriptional regulator [uncultured Litoreibacter sp.]